MNHPVHIPFAVGDVVMFKINDMVMPCAIVLRRIIYPVTEIIRRQIKDGLTA